MARDQKRPQLEQLLKLIQGENPSTQPSLKKNSTVLQTLWQPLNHLFDKQFDLFSENNFFFFACAVAQTISVQKAKQQTPTEFRNISA